MNEFLADFTPYFEPVAIVVSTGIIVSGVIQNFVYLVQLVFAVVSLRRNPPMESKGIMWTTLSEVSRPISILVPAYNEELTIIESVRSMLALHYPEFEVIVINDGSTDETLKVLIEAYDLIPMERIFQTVVEHEPIVGVYGSRRYPNLVVVDKENGGSKADAMNAGINVSRMPIFCAIDADSILEADALLRAVQPFIEDPDRVVAVGGTIRIINGCRVKSGRVTEVRLPKSLIARFQTIEYLRAFLIGRLGWKQLDALMLISGAFGIFRRDIASAVGGYDRDSLGEDLEIITKFHCYLREKKQDYRIEFVAEPVCWTEVPVSLKVLATQRIRWQRGAMQTFFKYRKMLFNPRYGRIGFIGMGHMLVADILGPIFEFLGYLLLPVFWATGLIDWEYLAAFFALAVFFGVFFSIGSLIIEELELHRYPGARNLVELAFLAVIENFGYRQINSYWRIVGLWRHFRRAESVWVPVPRAGFETE